MAKLNQEIKFYEDKKDREDKFIDLTIRESMLLKITIENMYKKIYMALMVLKDIADYLTKLKNAEKQYKEAMTAHADREHGIAKENARRNQILYYKKMQEKLEKLKEYLEKEIFKLVRVISFLTKKSEKLKKERAHLSKTLTEEAIDFFNEEKSKFTVPTKNANQVKTIDDFFSAVKEIVEDKGKQLQDNNISAKEFIDQVAKAVRIEALAHDNVRFRIMPEVFLNRYVPNNINTINLIDIKADDCKKIDAEIERLNKMKEKSQKYLDSIKPLINSTKKNEITSEKILQLEEAVYKNTNILSNPNYGTDFLKSGARNHTEPHTGSTKNTDVNSESLPKIEEEVQKEEATLSNTNHGIDSLKSHTSDHTITDSENDNAIPEKIPQIEEAAHNEESVLSDTKKELNSLKSNVREYIDDEDLLAKLGLGGDNNNDPEKSPSPHYNA